MKDNLCLIDGDSIIYLSCYSKKDYVKTYKDTLECVDFYVKQILENTNTNKYVGFLTDGSFRYKIGKIKGYKANRAFLEKPTFFGLVKSYLIDNYKFIIEKDLEADDLCIMTHQTLKDQYNITIASPDKDLKQIEANFYDYKKVEHTFISEAEANYRLWKQMLTGDAGDNITGLPGIGDVKASKLLEGSSDYRKTVFDTYIKHYGEYDGIINFTENYQLIKMLDTKYIPSEIQSLEIKKEELDF